MLMIREAIEEDLQGILNLYKQLFDNEEYSDIKSYRDKWREIKQYNNIKYFVAQYNGKIISTCHIIVVPNLTRNRRCYSIIENVITDKEYRNKGYGRKVIEKAIEFAKETNCYKVMLLSSNGRVESHAFYAKIGFDGNSKKGFQIRL
jgi:GNAT superfamily N-acetyltransferase